MVDQRLPKLRERRQFLGIDIYQGRARMQANSPTPTEYALVEDWQEEYNELELVIGTVDRLNEHGVTLADTLRLCVPHSMQVNWFSSWQLLLIAAATILFVLLVGLEIWQWMH